MNLCELLSPHRGVNREGLLEGHFSELSSEDTILRGDHYTPYHGGGCRSPTARVQALPLPSETGLWQSGVVAPLTGMSNTIGFGVTA